MRFVSVRIQAGYVTSALFILLNQTILPGLCASVPLWLFCSVLLKNWRSYNGAAISANPILKPSNIPRT